MEKYLPKCLGSLIMDDASLMQQLDVIVVNDGSKDRTSEIAHGFEEKYPGVFRVIDKVNGHYGSCVNAALKVATGKYLKMLDADDLYDTKGLGLFMHELQRIDNADVILTDVREIDDHGESVKIRRGKWDGNVLLSISDLIRKDGLIYIMHFVTYRTEILREAHYSQTEGVPYTDNEFVFYPMCMVKKLYRIPEVVYCYRLGRDGQSVDKKQLSNNSQCFIKIAERMMNWLKGCKKFEPVNAEYLRLWFVGFLAYIYRLYWFDFPLRKLQSELRPFDQCLESAFSSFRQKLAERVRLRIYKNYHIRMFSCGAQFQLGRITITRFLSALLNQWCKYRHG